MTTFLHFTYNCLHLLNQYVGTFWPVKVFFGSKRLQPPSTDTELKVLRIFYLLHHKSDITKFGFDIQELITQKRKAGDADAALDPFARPEVKAALQRTSFDLLVGFNLTQDQLRYNATR